MNKYIYLGILLTFIGILITTFVHTFWSAYVGTLLIFIGTILAAVVGIRSNRYENKKTINEVNDKLKEFQNKIDVIKDRALSKSAKKIVKKTEDQFINWANKFVQKKDQLVISQKKKMLSIEEEQLKQTAFWKEYILHFNQTLTNIISAINEKTGSKIVFTDFTMPSNLFTWDKTHNYLEIMFREDLFWLINYEIDIERKNLEISIKLRDDSIENMSEYLRSSAFYYGDVDINYYKENKTIKVSTRTPKLEAKELKKVFNLKGYKSLNELIIEKIFELQLLEL